MNLIVLQKVREQGIRFLGKKTFWHEIIPTFGSLRYRAVACDVTSAAFNQNVWQNVWYLYRERRVFNFSVVVERVTAKPLWHDNRLSVGTNILEGRERRQSTF